MRVLRMVFVVLLALILVGIALANRQMVTLSLFPANIDAFLGGRWSVDLPLFLVIFLAIAFGMLAGLVWEYLREAQYRREAREHRAQAAQLEGEVGHLRRQHGNPRDEVLAILDAPTPRGPNSATGTPAPAAGSTLPAPH